MQINFEQFLIPDSCRQLLRVLLCCRCLFSWLVTNLLSLTCLYGDWDFVSDKLLGGVFKVAGSKSSALCWTHPDSGDGLQKRRAWETHRTYLNKPPITCICLGSVHFYIENCFAFQQNWRFQGAADSVPVLFLWFQEGREVSSDASAGSGGLLNIHSLLNKKNSSMKIPTFRPHQTFRLRPVTN